LDCRSQATRSGQRISEPRPLVKKALRVAKGWYFVSAPIIAGNWTVDSSWRWEVPVGGGFGEIFKVGGQAFNTSLQAFDYVECPSVGQHWAVRFQIQLLFPK